MRLRLAQAGKSSVIVVGGHGDQPSCGRAFAAEASA
jgi:hypothetical protein